ncbi:MAG: chemotaxis protein CheW [Eubacteriales bacterium]|nr:chemotaxis protein CheW [Eubacteriales bacterium]NCC81851.1 purine-binding chemotaxis protein CheW [Clostridia bacterium]
MAEMQFVVFKLNNEEYGIEITSVEEILKYQDITNIPQADEYILGVINLRGKVIPIYNLKKKFYGENSNISEDTRIVVISHQDMSVGMIVDSVSEVLRISEDNIDLTNTFFSDKKNNSIVGIGKLDKRLLMIIDIKELFTEKEKSNFKEVL